MGDWARSVRVAHNVRARTASGEGREGGASRSGRRTAGKRRWAAALHYYPPEGECSVCRFGRQSAPRGGPPSRRSRFQDAQAATTIAGAPDGRREKESLGGRGERTRAMGGRAARGARRAAGLGGAGPLPPLCRPFRLAPPPRLARAESAQGRGVFWRTRGAARGAQFFLPPRFARAESMLLTR